METAEHFALRVCYSATVGTISRDLAYFSNQFIEHAFITASAAGGIHTRHCNNETEKAAELFTCVMAPLTHLSSPERVKLFEKFLGIVSNQVAYCDLAVHITETYGKHYHYKIFIANKFNYLCLLFTTVEKNPGYSGPLRGLLEGECLHALQIQFVGVDVYTIVHCRCKALPSQLILHSVGIHMVCRSNSLGYWKESTYCVIVAIDRPKLCMMRILQDMQYLWYNSYS